MGERGEEGVLPAWTGSRRSVLLSQLQWSIQYYMYIHVHIHVHALAPHGHARCGVLLPDDPGEQDAVRAVVVGGVVVAPELGAWEREVPELVNETAHSLLLSLQPLVIAVPRLQRKHAQTERGSVCKGVAWNGILEFGSGMGSRNGNPGNPGMGFPAHHKEFWLVERVGVVLQHLKLPRQLFGQNLWESSRGEDEVEQSRGLRKRERGCRTHTSPLLRRPYSCFRICSNCSCCSSVCLKALRTRLHSISLHNTHTTRLILGTLRIVL